MESDDKYKGIFLSRLMPCEECRKKGYPKKGQLFITFGGTSHKYKVRKVSSDSPTSKAGITPHFVQALGLNKKGDGVVIVSNCCIDGCEMNLKWNEKEGIYDIKYKVVKASVLPINEWEALVFRWHGGTGFEIE